MQDLPGIACFLVVIVHYDEAESHWISIVHLSYHLRTVFRIEISSIGYEVVGFQSHIAA
jgi:hypothetical protein